MLENCNQITKWPCLVVNLSPSNQSYHIILGLSWQNEKIKRETRDPVEHESSKEIKSKNDFIILVFFSMILFNFEKCE